MEETIGGAHTEVEASSHVEGLLGAGQHVEEEDHAGVEKEGFDEARLKENSIVQGEELLQSCEDVRLLLFEFFLQRRLRDLELDL